ncbi:MAG: hypothetical protein ABW158_15365 [Candidatus Thiodiazotropha sp. 6PDIVS]
MLFKALEEKIFGILSDTSEAYYSSSFISTIGTVRQATPYDFEVGCGLPHHADDQVKKKKKICVHTLSQWLCIAALSREIRG